MTHEPYAPVAVAHRMKTAPHANPRTEVMRVLAAAAEAGILLRAVGGLAVYLRCPSARRSPLERDYKDIDLVGSAGAAPGISTLLAELGYAADEEFNSLHGHQRLFFWDSHNARQLDVFIERIVMCHALDVRDRFGRDVLTLSPADLLLTKIQVVETNEKDLKDAAALLADHDLAPDDIDPRVIVSLLSLDWGWWRTGTETLRKIAAYVQSLDGFDQASVVTERVRALLQLVDDAPKSTRWKLRARIGERVRWYELPEEIEG
ncbi:MAG: hypothetical protein ACRDK3_06350 [Actinomycetota bacterium]